MKKYLTIILIPFFLVTYSWAFLPCDFCLEDDAYDATTWNGNMCGATKDAIRDKIETVAAAAAPVGAKYIVQQADGTLTNEQALGALATGMVKNTTTTGALSIGVEGTDYYKPSGTDVAIADGGTGSSTAAAACSALGVGTEDSPQFTGVDITGVTDGNVPYMASGAAGFADSPLSRTGANTVQLDDRIDITDGTDTHIIKAVDEPGLEGRLTIGLDETARTMVICDAGDVDTDFGLSVRTDPSLFIASNSDKYLRIQHDGILSTYIGQFTMESQYGFNFQLAYDRTTGDAFVFDSGLNRELEDTDGEQSWLYIEPKLNGANTSPFNSLQIKTTETAIGTGGHNLIKAGTSVDDDMFMVDNVGRIKGLGLIPSTKTDDYVVTTADLGKSLRMNSADDKNFTLPSVGTTEDGARLTFIKQGTGKMTITAVDSDYIHDSSAAGTIYSITNYATITLEYVHGMTRWVVISANGTFTTT